MRNRTIIGITVLVLALIVGGTYYLLMQADTHVAGIEKTWNIDAGRIIKDKVLVSPAKGRTLELQEYDRKAKEWKTRKTFRLKGKKKDDLAALTISFPRNWADAEYTTWRLHIPRSLGAKEYTSGKIHITAINLGTISGLRAKAAVVMDMQTKQVLYGVNMHERLPNASTTKMMTAIVSMSRCSGDEEVKFTKEVVDTQQGLMWKKKGDIFRMSDLWKAMLIMSANDAAAGAAYGTTGDLQEFVDLMNETAQKMKLKDTHFMNVHGLDETGHYSSAYDLALICRRAMNYSAFREDIQLQKYTFQALNHPKRVNYCNTTNELLKKNISGYLGGKTGTTTAAGNCYVGVYEYNGRKYVTAVLGAKDRWKATRKLMRYVRQYGRQSSSQKAS